MSIETLGAIGELVGGVAVIFTLIFLAFQVRDNTREQKRRRELEAHELLMSLSNPLTDNGTIPEVMVDGAQDYKALSRPDQIRFNNLMMKAVRILEVMNRLERAGNTEKEDRLALERMVFSILASPGGRFWWTRSGMDDYFTPATRRLVEDLLVDGEAKKYLFIGGPSAKELQKLKEADANVD